MANSFKVFGLWAACALAAVPGCNKSQGSTLPPAEQLGTFADFSGGGAADGGPAPQAEPGVASGSVADEAEVARNRPGLGTEYGETRQSRITTVPFSRSSNTPDATLALFYNDEAGIRQVARFRGKFDSAMSRVTTPNKTLAVSIVDPNGRVLPAADVAGRRYAVGAPGQRYQVGIENNSGFRFEAVASVDGLDVMDGSEAMLTNRGYILEPFTSMTIDGWRTSQDTVAAFRFASVDNSYAERRGKGRNIGVIGVAFFHEEDGGDWDELRRRHSARPFAPPPP